MVNFRADRAREILSALLDPGFDGFARPRVPVLAIAAGMVEYSSALAAWMTAIFPPQNLADTLGERSEEHTSELQSLMRISYAVFCLKKKNTKNTHINKQ